MAIAEQTLLLLSSEEITAPQKERWGGRPAVLGIRELPIRRIQGKSSRTDIMSEDFWTCSAGQGANLIQGYTHFTAVLLWPALDPNPQVSIAYYWSIHSIFWTSKTFLGLQRRRGLLFYQRFPWTLWNTTCIPFAALFFLSLHRTPAELFCTNSSNYCIQED